MEPRTSMQFRSCDPDQDWRSEAERAEAAGPAARTPWQVTAVGSPSVARRSNVGTILDQLSTFTGRSGSTGPAEAVAGQLTILKNRQNSLWLMPKSRALSPKTFWMAGKETKFYVRLFNYKAQ